MPAKTILYQKRGVKCTQMKDIFPCQLFRAELIKAIKYPEISYRKY